MALITPFDPWKNSICTCPPKYSLSAYTGCGHGCLYCYASSYIRNFSHPREKKDFLVRLRQEIKKVPSGSTITIANSSDPYLTLEKQLGLTRQALKVLSNYDLKINIVTKSSLVLKDIDILKDLKKVLVSISITTLDKKLSSKLEPYAPSPKERLKAIEELSKFLPTLVRFDPLIYPLNTSKIKEIIKKIKLTGAKQIITSTYKVRPDNYKRMVLVFSEYEKIWNKLYLREGERTKGYIYLAKELRKKLIQKVHQAALKEGLEFSSCREGFESLNTRPCDGSSFF